MKKLETRRLILREWRETDADDLYAYAKSDKVGPMCGWKPHKDILETKEILKQFSEQDETWALELKETGRVIGSLGEHKTKKEKLPLHYDFELGYALSEEYWGRGLAPEAAARAIKFAFLERDAKALIVSHFPFNFRSKRVIEKLGFQYCSRLEKSWKRYDGLVLDELVYVMTRERYFQLYAAISAI